MGIRTRGFEKVSRSTDVEKIPSQDTAVKTEAPVVIKDLNESKPTSSNKSVEQTVKSPVKDRTTASMARLGGIKVAARKLKKHRKRRLFVQTANKLLRSSIKSNKNRRPCRVEEKKRAGPVLPSRISTRTCLRRNSREGIPDAPLRTVELIKRPLELREPATKLLYMASLGLYPKTGESDMTPIVVIKELTSSPGKKNGVRKSLELPLIPRSLFQQIHKRVVDLTNQDKRHLSENMKPDAKQQLVRSSRKSASPSTIKDAGENKSDAESKKRTSTRSSTSPPSSVKSEKQSASKSIIGAKEPKKTFPDTAKQKLASPPPLGIINPTVSSSVINSLLLNHVLATANKGLNIIPVQETVSKSNSKSLLKSNLSPPSKAISVTPSLSKTLLNLAPNLPMKPEIRPTPSTSSLPTASSVSQAMNLIMSNITILPASVDITLRKRPLNSITSLNSTDSSHPNITTPALAGKKPPKKKQRMIEENGSALSPLTPVLTPPPPQVNSYNNVFLNTVSPPGNPEEALNLCVKKKYPEPPPVTNMGRLSARPENGVGSLDAKVNGSRPLNLIIPRPPPLIKAPGPVEITNIANVSQNIQPAVPGKKSRSNKGRKSRQNLHQLTQSNLQMLPPVPMLPTDTSVHAKSLLKCMNGEENSCAREVGETLDSVKTMLARLQTRIGPAVNGVRLITIE